MNNNQKAARSSSFGTERPLPHGKFENYRFVDWVDEIYLPFKGESRAAELAVLADVIIKNDHRRILDLALGGGGDLSCLLQVLSAKNHRVETPHANEIDQRFLALSCEKLQAKQQSVIIHQALWNELDRAVLADNKPFDFAYLLGNSLSVLGGATPHETRQKQQAAIDSFAQLIKSGGHLFLDIRNFDHILSRAHCSFEERAETTYSTKQSVCYHGTDRVTVIPEFATEEVMNLDYYDHLQRTWSRLTVYPIRCQTLHDLLSPYFIIEQIFYDYQITKRENCLFLQFLARRK